MWELYSWWFPRWTLQVFASNAIHCSIDVLRNYNYKCRLLDENLWLYCKLDWWWNWIDDEVEASQIDILLTECIGLIFTIFITNKVKKSSFKQMEFCDPMYTFSEVFFSVLCFNSKHIFYITFKKCWTLLLTSIQKKLKYTFTLKLPNLARIFPKLGNWMQLNKKDKNFVLGKPSRTKLDEFSEVLGTWWLPKSSNKSVSTPHT